MLLILSAMPQEIEALLPTLDPVSRIQSCGREVAAGRLAGLPVTLAFSRWGKVAAAATAAHLITTARPSRVLFTGIAGSLRDELGIGDVVLARNLYQHDLDASPFFPPTHIPLLNTAALPADAAFTAELHSALDAFMAEDLHRTLGDQARRLAPNRRSLIGDIATGDQVIGDSATRERVRSRVPSAVCVEMEGAAVAQVCHEFGVPFACLRVISDHADERVNPVDIFELARLSGHYTVGMLRRWMTAKRPAI
jgi:adenosylhomocysteine nucleosidase